MKTKITILVINLLLVSNSSFGQRPPKYNEHIKEANRLFRAKEYKASTIEFKKAFDEFEGKAYQNDRYNAAKAYALSGDFDNAFYHLIRYSEKIWDYSNFDVPVDPNFKILHSDSRWETLVELITIKKEEYELEFEYDLITILDSIDTTDKLVKLATIEHKHGFDSEEMKSCKNKIMQIDSMNSSIVTKFLDAHGWLGPNKIGHKGNRNLWSVIINSDLETQNKYLPMLKEAVKLGNAEERHLKSLEERIKSKKK